MTSPLDDNLSALAEADAPATAWLNQPAGPGGPIVEGTGDDVRLITADGRSLRLHSARDPRREADAQVAQAVGERGSATVAIVGAGAGFVLEALEAMPGIRILVIEPSRELALAWLERRSWRTLIESGRLRLLVGPAYAGSAGASQFLGDSWTRLPVVVNPVLARESPSAVTRAREVLDRAAREALQNADARSRFEDLAFRNTIANLPRLLREGDAAGLTGAFSGRPAIVLGAGPSLDANVASLRGLPASCVVIAADTAVVPCLKGGLTPHLAVALDPSTDNARHLTRYAIPESVHLVCEASVDPSVPLAFAGRTFFFRVGRHAPWPWLEAAGVSLGMLEAWGSVVTSAIDVACRAGCSPIVFAGLDLAFTGGRPYCRHTPLDEGWTWKLAAGDRLEDLWTTYRTARPTVPEPAIEGGDTPSAPHLLSFRDWIRDYAASRSHVRFLNGTGAGILQGAAIEQVRLEAIVSGLDAADPSDITAAVRRLRAATRRPGPDADVISRLASASQRELLEGHSDPSGAAARPALAEVVGRVVQRSADDRAEPGVGIGPTAVTPASLASVWLPEAAQGLLALDPTRRAPPVGESPLDEARTRESLAVAFAAIGTVLRQAPGATPPVSVRDSRAHAWVDVPAAVQVDWPPHVRPVVETATAALHEALRSAGWPIRLAPTGSPYFDQPSDPRVEIAMTAAQGAESQAVASDGQDALVWQWALTASAALGADHGLGRVIDGLRAGRPPVLPSPRAGSGLKLWLGPGGTDGSTGGDPLPFLHARAVMRAATGLLTLDPSSARRPMAHSARTEPFHLFALPESWQPDGVTAAPWSTILEPDVLTDRGLRACRIATRLDAEHALLTRFDGTGSYVVDAAGRLRRSEAWPERVDGEVAIGDESRLAWSWDGASYLLFRQRSGARVRRWALPVAPMFVLSDGTDAAFLATTGGLWHWRADTGPVPLAPGPVLVAVHRHGNGIRAYPRPSVLEDGCRVAVDRAFDWSVDAPRAVEHAIVPGDACFSRSVQGGWTVDTRMDASAIRITHTSGPTFWLACSGPRAAAWAGRSLLVTLLPHGDVLLFRNVLDVLDPLVAAPPLASH